MKVQQVSPVLEGGQSTTSIEFELQESWTLAEYLKSARAQGVPMSEAQHSLVNQLIRSLENAP